MKKITVPCKKKTNNCDIHVNQQGGLYLTAVHFQLLTNVNEEVESLGKSTKFMIFLRQRNILSITMMNRTTETRFQKVKFMSDPLSK